MKYDEFLIKERIIRISVERLNLWLRWHTKISQNIILYNRWETDFSSSAIDLF